MNIKHGLLVFILFIVLCGSFFTSFYKGAKGESVKHLNTEQLLYARQAARGIEGFFAGWMTVLTVLSETSHIKNMDKAGKENIEKLYKDNSELIRTITRVDAKGRIIYTVPYDRNSVGKNISSQKHIRKIMHTHEPVVSDVFFAVQGYSTVALHVPVFKDKRYNGTIAIGINFESLAKRHLEPIRIGQTGYAWVTSRDGTELFCPVPGHVGKSVFENCKDFPSILAMAEEMLKGHEGSTIYSFDKIRGDTVETVKKHAVYIPVNIGNTFWSIVVASSEDEVLSSLKGFRNRLIVVMGFILIGGILFSFYVSKALFIIKEEEKRRSVEKALRESEAKFRKEQKFTKLLLDTSPALIVAIDFDGNTIMMNQAMLDILEYTNEEISGVNYLNTFVPEADREKLAVVFQDIIKEGKATVNENRIISKSGKIYLVEWHGRTVIHKEGDIDFFVGAGIDVTFRKQAEEHLKLNEEKYRSIFENAVMGIFQTTPEGKYLSVNPAGAKMYGYDSPEDMIRSVADIYHQIYVNPEDRKRLREILDDKGRIEGFEAEHFRKDGSRIWTFLNARVVCDDSGSVLYYDVTIEDITEHKRLESQLLQSRKMEAIGTLAGGVAHDFNNILSAIMGYTSLLQMKTGKNEPFYSYLKQIFLSTEKAANLTQSLLAFSRKQFIKPQALDLNEAISKVSNLLSRLITEDIELKIVLQPEKLIIMADAGQIDQIILNLVTNGRDAMPNGGILTISTKRVLLDDQFKSIHGFGAKGDFAAISVVDTGPGMDAKTREKIFEPFFTTKEVGKGTGLGLSIIYGIVEQHNGFIDVSSELDRGTTFIVYLPLTEKGIESKINLPEDILRGTETILIAEDNDDLRTLTKTVLESNGYTVIEAMDGSEAVAKFLEHMPDFTILDVVMPKKNGKEVYDEIKRINPQAKGLFTSGYTDDILHQKGIMEEGLNFISKPFSPIELLRTIRKILDKK
jgi:PAS domain S-box-containing protein